MNDLESAWDLTGKVAFVTGAGRGVGRGIARILALSGMDVAVNALTPKFVGPFAQELAAESGRRVGAYPADFTKSDPVNETVAQVIADFGWIDVLVNAMGEGYIEKLIPAPGGNNEGVDDEKMRFIMDLNLTSTIIATRAVGPHMVGRGSGKVINISSHAARRGGDGAITTTAKTALEGFTRAMALEWAPYNVQVNSIAPGGFPNDISHPPETLAPFVDEWLARVPVRRFGTVEECGHLARYLAAPASNYMTGQVLYLDGGLTL